MVPYDNSLHPPARDLFLEGQVIDPDRAMTLIRQGRDISRINPERSDIWDPLKSPPKVTYPKPGTEFDFHSFRTSAGGLFRANLDTRGGAKKGFTLLASLDLHAALMRAKLLLELNYIQVMPEWYPQLKIHFKTEEQLRLFKVKLLGDTLPNPNRWIVAESKTSLIMRDILLAPPRVELQQYFWGSVADSTLQNRRALRALIVPFSLLDIGESLNIFAWAYGKKVGQSIALTHPFAEKFQNNVTIDDLRWIGRKIAQLDSDAWLKIAKASAYPPEVVKLMHNKLKARRNDMVKILRLNKEFGKIDYKKNITEGQIKKGKIQTEFYPGYANRFSHTDPLSPLRFGEMFRYLAMKTINAGLELAASQLGDLSSRDVQEYIEGKQRKEFEAFKKAIEQGQPYKLGLRNWTGPIGGVSFNAGRDVITGTYYGSDAPVQLVDIIGVGANIGVFSTLKGLPRSAPTPSGQVQAAVHRSFVHVRPIPDLQTGFKTDWGSLFVPFHLKKISKILDVDLECDEDPNGSIDLTDANCRDQLDQRLTQSISDFKDIMSPGQTIIITDSLSLGGNASVVLPLTALLGPVGAMGNAIVSGGYNWLNTRKVMIERTTEGIKIYVQKLKTKGPSFGFDLNFFVNLFHTQARTKKGHAENLFFKVPLDNLNFEQKIKLVSSLHSLFKKPMNNGLAQNFNPYELDHDLLGKFNNTKILWFFRDKLRMGHTLTVRPPRHDTHQFNPQDFERTLYRERVVRRRSKSISRFAGDIASVAFRGIIGNNQPPGQYAANDFWGRGKLESISTEVELTPGAKFEPVVVLEDVWSGWSIKKTKLVKILKGLERNLGNVVDVRPLFNFDLFHDTKNVHAYEIRSTIILYPKLINHVIRMFEGASEKNLLRILVVLYGVDEYKHFCQNAKDFFGDNGPQVYYGKERYACALPFMQTVMKTFRKGLPGPGKKRVQKINDIVSKMMGNITLGRLIENFGKDGLFHVINVNGFRTYDENGDNALQSHTIGVFDQYLGAGPFRDLANQTGISNFELNASFFAQGY